jgi:hypothetical protein
MRAARNARRAAVALAGLLIGAGCASRGATAPRYDRTRISEAEIAEVEVRTTALQLVQRLRPVWLQGRGPAGLREERPLPVYVNDQRLGGPEVLQRYTAGEIREILFLDASAATQRFGTGHTSGAILIVLRSDPAGI